MILVIIIALIIALAISYVVGKNAKEHTTVKISSVLFIIFFVMIIISFVFFILIQIKTGEYEEKTSQIEIVSLNDNSYVSGHGNMHYVTINSTGGYTFYYQLESGGYVQQTIDASKAVVYQDEVCEKPTVTAYTTYYNKLIPMTEKQEEFWTFCFYNKAEHTRYEIHVPKGTIIEEFKLNSEH